MSADLKRKVAVGVALAFLVFVALLFYGDVQEIIHLVQNFQWRLIPAILALTTFSYFLRGVRFHYYLRQVGVSNISLWTSLRVFIGGFSLSLTPGKLGEFIRLLWLKNIANADPARTAPSIVVDRIIDGLAMAMLASVGALAYPQLWSAVAAVLVILIAGVVIIQIRPLALWILNLGETLPFVSKIMHHLQALYESTYELLRLKSFLVGLSVGLVVWAAQGVAFYLVLIGLGATPSLILMLLAIFTVAVGAILGSLSSLPGGLGATEATMTAILQAAVGLTQGLAATATLVIRFFTLWFGVILGILIVVIWRKMLFGKNYKFSDLNGDVSSPLGDPELTYE